MACGCLSVLVFIFDSIAFSLALAAEQRRYPGRTVIQADGSSYCQYASDKATGRLSVGAFVFLLASQLLVMVASRCLCCGRARSRSCSRKCDVVLFITCWLAFLIAETCLLCGSVRNAYHTKYRTYISSAHPPSCETMRRGVFGAGAAFVAFTGILSELLVV